ncbi:hypothetical protein SADUNF_Sadunf01G0000600 [Salix dunnii]|uniref:Uncharacterized protein n=1 Tax=Salix dunnii TaxID=1413687 RepID=A0A835N9F3_9ROSI|nr:hypothetical protein SADUNF_Sadunf01G0000600 [Salix dunnii]
MVGEVDDSSWFGVIWALSAVVDEVAALYNILAASKTTISIVTACVFTKGNFQESSVFGNFFSEIVSLCNSSLRFKSNELGLTYSGDRVDVVHFLQWIAICHRLLQEVCSINTLAIIEFELVEIASFELGVLSDCTVLKLDHSLHI